jgi:hypothetical protein
MMMRTHNRVLLVSLLAAMSLPTATALASVDAALPPAQRAGSITYLSGGSDPAQATAMRGVEARYPLELNFLWGRGAKETEVAGVEWSIRNAAGHELLDVRSGGPLVLASLPDGRYTVTARYDGTALSRAVAVHKGMHDDLLLEWPE